MLVARQEDSRSLSALVVEDDQDLAALVARYLEAAGFRVNTAATGPSGLLAVRRDAPDLVVLDLGLPGMDGIEVCRQIRKFSDCYIIILTARAQEEDTLTGLASGADDYMTKPFSPREVAARAVALLRRPRWAASGRRIVVGRLEIDPAAHVARIRGSVVPLTKTEFDILAALATQLGTALDREQILRQLWGDGWFGDPRAVDVHVTHLRAKLGPRAGVAIRTVRGVGYRLEATENNVEEH
jgi:DNA-binding response OmpR family regulator